MKNRTFFFTLSAIGLALGAVPLSGCGYLKARAARHAYARYQDAIAAGDTARARTALMELVRTEEDVADYWIELGKLQLQLGQYREAYDAFSHAHELDRSNAQVLAIMAQMALLSGEMDVANEHAQSLSLIAPDNPTVTLIRGFAALKSGELDKADAAADSLLASAPNESFAATLKSRVLVARDKIDEAIAFLESQHRAAPTDRAAIHSLIDLYRLKGDWRSIARVQSDAHKLDPKNALTSLALVEALLRAGDPPAAMKVSAALLTPAADPRSLDQVLTLWAQYAPRGTSLPDGMKLAQAVSGDRRASFANYYNSVGNPAAAAALLGGDKLPITHENARWNAVFAQTLVLQGKTVDAKRLLDMVLDREPDQVDGLRSRIALQAKTGLAKQAVVDAQRLVTISPRSGGDRLLLAQAYLAAGNRDGVRRALWQAFQDLPDDESVFSALRSVLASTGDVDGERRLNEEFRDRHVAKLTKELV